MPKLVIRTENLTCDFETVRALDNLSLEIPQGIIFGFLGPNGSSKTTTIRLLLGLLEPSAGSAEVFGYDVRTQSNAIQLPWAPDWGKYHPPDQAQNSPVG